MDNQNLTPPPFREDITSSTPEVIVETADAAKLFTKVFYWMTGALGLTALTAFLVFNSTSLFTAIVTNRALMWGLLLAELGLVFLLSASIRKLSFPMAALMMAVYSVLNGATMSVIFAAYSGSSIVAAFAISAGMFAVMALIGTVTKRDLSSWGSILFMALVGLIIASVVNIFLHSSVMQWIVSMVGVVLFSALTIYDTNKIRKQLVEFNGQLSEEDMHKVALMGSLELYLDFVNLFLYILRFFNRR